MNYGAAGIIGEFLVWTNYYKKFKFLYNYIYWNIIWSSICLWRVQARSSTQLHYPSEVEVKVIQNYILTLKFVKGKNHKHSKRHIYLQNQAIYVDKKKIQDGASSVQVDKVNT